MLYVYRMCSYRWTVKEAVLGLFRLLSTDCQEVGFVLVLQHGILCHRDLSLPGKGLKNEE